MQRLFCLVLIVGSLATTGCHLKFNHAERRELLYGVTTVSRPISVDAKHLKDNFDIEISKELDFEYALEQTRNPQSLAARRREVRQQVGFTGSIDPLKLKIMDGLMDQGLLTSGVLAQLTPPEVTAPTLLRPNMDFAKSPIENDSNVAVPLIRRLQIATNDTLGILTARSAPVVFKALMKDYDMKFVFTTITVQPGIRTRYNSEAEIRVKWECEGCQSTDFHVTPIFPTYEAVGQVDDAASLDTALFFLQILAVYGPAKGQGDYQRLVNDLRALRSASHRVTLTGSMVSDKMMTFRLAGLREADPLGELRPSGKTRMEPVVLPVVAIAMVKKTGSENKNTSTSLTMKYSGRWLRKQPWYARIFPGNYFPGFWSDPGTPFQNEMSYNKRDGTSDKKTGTIEKNWLTTSYHEYKECVVFEQKAEEQPKAPVIDNQLLKITSPYQQWLLVKIRDGEPNSYFLDGYPVNGKKAAKDHYAIEISETVLQRMHRAKTKNADKKTTELCAGQARLQVFNAVGTSTGTVNLSYFPQSSWYPSTNNQETLVLKKGDNERSLTRHKGQAWSSEELKALDDKQPIINIQKEE